MPLNPNEQKLYRRNLTLIITLSVLIGTLLLSFYGRYQAEKQPKAAQVRVVEVHDGDTISVILDGKREKVRLIGIDAPELGQKPWGQRSKKHLKELLDLSGWTVSLEFDVEKRDKHGRLLCYIRTSDGMMLNIQMLKDGYAMLFTVPPNIRYVDELRKAQHEAREKGLGIWSSKGLRESPSEYREKHPRL